MTVRVVCHFNSRFILYQLH